MTDLATLKPLVEIMAAERTTKSPHLFEDAVQEGLISAWQAREQRPGKPETYYRAAARNGVTSVVRGRPFTGADGHQGKPDAHDYAGPLLTMTDDGAEVLAVDPADTSTADALDAAEIRDHVRAAVRRAGLGPLDLAIVFGRYWRDMGFAELAEELGRPAGTLSRRWTQTIRPILAAQLEGSVTCAR